MSKNNNLTDFLTDIANTIRTKKGTSGAINPQNFSNEISTIQTGVDTSDANATASDIKVGKTAYVNGSKLTGVYVKPTLPTLNAPTISLSGSTLTITNPSTNGNFVTGYNVYSGDTLIASPTATTVNLSTYLTEAGTYSITVKASGTGFNDSVASNSVGYTVASEFNVVLSYVYNGRWAPATLSWSSDNGTNGTLTASTQGVYVTQNVVVSSRLDISGWYSPSISISPQSAATYTVIGDVGTSHDSGYFTITGNCEIDIYGSNDPS